MIISAFQPPWLRGSKIFPLPPFFQMQAFLIPYFQVQNRMSDVLHYVATYQLISAKLAD